jgi:ribulose-phosphate 3-epimerase
MKPVVAPSILAADFTALAAEIRRMEEAGAAMIHVDVMDGHFVPNLTVGLPVVQAIRRVTRLHLDVHLMISNPEEMAVRYVRAGANSVTVHYEAAVHLNQVLRDVRTAGAWAGVVLNPHTPVCVLEEILPDCDLVLIMSVNPGFGGQEFIRGSLEKVRKLKTLISRSGRSVRVEMDGGIGPANAAEAVGAGVDILVAGSAIFSAEDPQAAWRQMQAEADRAWSGKQ